MSIFKLCIEKNKLYQERYGLRTIVLTQVGSFFEVYGLRSLQTNEIEDVTPIREFSAVCDLNIVDKDTTFDNKQVVLSGFKDIQIERYIKKLQDADFTVVVYKQDSDGKEPTRSLAGIFSPGTYFAPESTQLTNSVACLWVDVTENKLLRQGRYVTVGMTNIDIYTGETSLYQYQTFYANNPTTFDDADRFFSIHNPSEVVVISNAADLDMERLVSYAGIHARMVHHVALYGNATMKSTEAKKCEKQLYQKEILSLFYHIAHYTAFVQQFNDNHIATQSLCYLLDFVHQHSPHLVRRIREPRFENVSQRLTLANHSLRQLNIIPDGAVNHTAKLSCVAHMLNVCRTPMGRRAFHHRLLHPTCEVAALQKEYDITEHILSRYDVLTETLKPKLQSIHDLAKCTRSMLLKKIAPKSFCALVANMETVRGMFAILSTDATVMTYLRSVIPSVDEVDTLSAQVCEFIQSRIDVQLAINIDQTRQFDVNFICRGVDEQLDQTTDILQRSEQLLESIRGYFSSLVETKDKGSSKSAAKTEYVRVHETEKNVVSLICTARRCKLLFDALPEKEMSVTLDRTFELVVSKRSISFEKQSSTNQFIVHRQLSRVCQDVADAKIIIQEQTSNVYERFVEEFATTMQPSLDVIAEFVTYVDLLYAKAHIAYKFHYCKPTLQSGASKAFVNAKGLRHALVERLHTDELFVTNDVLLGDGCIDGILLYGTNAVGKTTIIRALGIAVVLAQAGLFVPCTSFVFKPYRQMFTRILGNDNLFKGLSTFEVEMLELRTVLQMADADSLTLGDELCSGTETTSAISIFVAGIQHLSAQQSSFIFATHLHEIVNYDEITSLATLRLKHMEVSYNHELDALVYDRKLKDGSGASMYGLEVCKSLHLPSAFLETANAIRLKYNDTGGRSVLSQKSTRYNAHKIVRMCEKCGLAEGKEVHHLQHQADANERGFIQTSDTVFHKNAVANLMTLCEKCHDEAHHAGKPRQRKVRTTRGVVAIDV